MQVISCKSTKRSSNKPVINSHRIKSTSSRLNYIKCFNQREKSSTSFKSQVIQSRPFHAPSSPFLSQPLSSLLLLSTPPKSAPLSSDSISPSSQTSIQFSSPKPISISSRNISTHASIFHNSEMGSQERETTQPIFWSQEYASIVNSLEIDSKSQLAKQLLLLPPDSIPQQALLPLFLNYQNDSQSISSLTPYDDLLSLSDSEKLEYQLFQTIIPHHFSQDFINGSLCQSFTTFPRNWEHHTFTSNSIPISLSSKSIQLHHLRQLLSWNYYFRNPSQATLFPLMSSITPQNHDLIPALSPHALSSSLSSLQHNYSQPYSALEKYSSTRPQLKLTGSLHKLIVDPWCSDMIRFDTTTLSRVTSRFVIDYDIQYNILLPPVINDRLINHPFNSNEQLSRQFKLSPQTKANMSFNRLPGDHVYSTTDPMLLPGSNLYSLPLRFKRLKFLPVAIPSSFKTLKSISLLSIIASILRQIPPMSSPNYPQQFLPFPITFPSNSKSQSKVSTDTIEDFVHEINLYKKFTNFELFHIVSPFYPQSQPPKSKNYDKEKKNCASDWWGSVRFICYIGLVNVR